MRSQLANAKHKPWLVWLACIGLAGLLPWWAGEYRLFQISQFCVVAIALLGLNLITGWCGQISLGHGAFFALGSYCSAILMLRAGIPDWATLPAAAVLCLVTGWLFGRTAARLEGLYLALASFALAVALPQLLKHPMLGYWTGGTGGLVLDAAVAPFWWPFDVATWLYWLTTGVLMLMTAVTLHIVRGRHGRAMMALRDHPIAAASIGIPVAAVKAKAFAVSAMYAGIAGGLSAALVRYVGPDSFDVFLSISFLVGIVVGGLASVTGSILGAAFVQTVPHAAEHLSQEAAWAVYGVFLLLTLWLAPGGIAALLRRLLGSISSGRN